MNRVFILRTDQNAAQLMAFLKQNAKAMAQQNRPLEVVVREHKPKGTSKQRALMWVVLQQIADHAWVNGQQYSAEDWHQAFREKFLPEQSETGAVKYRYLPNDSRILSMSTEQLSKQEKSDYLEQIMAYATGTLGVEVQIIDTQH